MTGIALGVAIALSIPLALLVTRLRWLAVPVLGGLGVFYTIPSLALIIFLVPLFGLNATSVIVAMVLYTQVILVRNLTVGLAGINPAVLEAARGMGMTVAQRWWQVQVPLVLLRLPHLQLLQVCLLISSFVCPVLFSCKLSIYKYVK